MSQHFLHFQQVFFQTSLLLYETTNNFLPLDTLTQTSGVNALLPIHPLVCIGASGLFANALNFMPIGRLDGGRVAMAVAGRQSANAISTALLIGQAISFLAEPNPIMLFWTIFVVLLQRGPDLPPIDDVTQVATDEDDSNKGIKWFTRAFSLVACSLISGAMILPAPQDMSGLNTNNNIVDNNGIPITRKAPIDRDMKSGAMGSYGGRDRAPPPPSIPINNNDPRPFF